MTSIELKIDNLKLFVDEDEIRSFESHVKLQREKIYNKTGAGSDFLGWVNLPSSMDQSIINSIVSDAAKIRSNSEVVVVVGIGGSYLGSRAVIDALNTSFPISTPDTGANPQIIYAGQNISEDYTHELLAYLNNKEYSIIVISKSGTTTEPAIAFRLLKNHIENKYGQNGAASRIYAITDVSKGALIKLAKEKGYKTYVIPDDVGGRFSVLTPVGLLPIAAAGYDISELINGAAAMESLLREGGSVTSNPAALYAVVRNILYRKGKTNEILATYSPNLVYFAEWWKQLYGESEGKDMKGIFPASVNFTSDLHSLGQYIQDGIRNIFETVIRVKLAKNTVEIPYEADNLDGLNYLAGKRLSYVNSMAEVGTILAHVDGQVPNIEIIVPQINERTLGELIYFFEMGCAISGYLLGVNPFDQPGVEAYKSNMFALLEKPGHEAETAKIKLRVV